MNLISPEITLLQLVSIELVGRSDPASRMGKLERKRGKDSGNRGHLIGSGTNSVYFGFSL